MHKRRGFWRKIRIGGRERGEKKRGLLVLSLSSFPVSLHTDPRSAILAVTDRQPTTSMRHLGGRGERAEEDTMAHAANDDRRAAWVQQSNDKCQSAVHGLVALVTVIDILLSSLES